jgi:hypothetical protein
MGIVSPPRKAQATGVVIQCTSWGPIKQVNAYPLSFENEKMEMIQKLSVHSGVETMVSNPVRPTRTAHLENLADRLADSPTGLRSLSN